MVTLRERPEARWALWAGIAGLLVAAALQVKAIFASSSATAAIGFVLVPLIAALTAAAAGIWGLALGHVVERLRGKVQGPPTSDIWDQLRFETFHAHNGYLDVVLQLGLVGCGHGVARYR